MKSFLLGKEAIVLGVLLPVSVAVAVIKTPAAIHRVRKAVADLEYPARNALRTVAGGLVKSCLVVMERTIVCWRI
jgi:hypothetical protein